MTDTKRRREIIAVSDSDDEASTRIHQQPAQTAWEEYTPAPPLPPKDEMAERIRTYAHRPGAHVYSALCHSIGSTDHVRIMESLEDERAKYHANRLEIPYARSYRNLGYLLDQCARILQERRTDSRSYYSPGRFAKHSLKPFQKHICHGNGIFH